MTMNHVTLTHDVTSPTTHDNTTTLPQCTQAAWCLDPASPGLVPLALLRSRFASSSSACGTEWDLQPRADQLGMPGLRVSPWVVVPLAHVVRSRDPTLRTVSHASLGFPRWSRVAHVGVRYAPYASSVLVAAAAATFPFLLAGSPAPLDQSGPDDNTATHSNHTTTLQHTNSANNTRQHRTTRQRHQCVNVTSPVLMLILSFMFVDVVQRVGCSFSTT